MLLDSLLAAGKPEVENKYKDEKQDAFEAMQDALDDYGDFQLLPNGMLAWDCYLAAYSIMVR
jgi:hypothetical protein